MSNSYDKDLVSESSQQLNQTLLSNRKMTENSLRMRAMAYLAQAKANLLTETIFEVESSRKHMEKELVYKDEMLLAQSRHAAMGEMISMIAHQWRQPISVISMDANNILVDIELDMIDKEKFKESASDVLKQTQELSKTIDDFRGFFRPDKSIKRVSMKDVVDETLKIINSSLISSNIEVKVRHESNQECETYSRELMQVIINLLNNAKDALVEKRSSQREVLISEELIDGRVVLNICDNGGGIDDEVIQRVFEPYFTTKSEKNGTGLGLYMSKTIVEKHLHGSISVSNAEQGACFKISLPLTISGRGDIR
ncbi:MAG: HAMP domain-containing sensor histidine kinase [Campylobacterota bacterium]|nr:HAMP domain-containing sensor histidine kinase [Campylobacterota bacterium]